MHTITHTITHRPLDQMTAEWTVRSRSPESRTALSSLAAAEGTVASLHLEDLGDLVAFMRGARTPPERERAAALLGAMVRSQQVHPMIPRAILQALVPGLIATARRLSWGSGGDWDGAAAFLSDAIATAWEVIVEWSGQDRGYAALDLLSAIRCRLRRQLLRQRSGREHLTFGLDMEALPLATPSGGTTDLDELVRAIEGLDGRSLDPFDAAVLYANRVLGLTMTELSEMSGTSRRHVTCRRDRAAQEVLHECA